MKNVCEWSEDRQHSKVLIRRRWFGEEMEQSLAPNETYSLSTKEDSNHSKELFFVKLTDSSLRAVEEYLENKAAIKGHPKIQFFGQTGVFHLPSRPGSASQDVGKNFKFSCSFFARDGRQGITDCLHQSSKQHKMLGSMGMMEKKIAVMGTDEAYEMTRNKMAQADQERKGIRTKEIKINHSKSKKKIAPVGKDMNIAVKKKLAGSSSLLKPKNGFKLSSTTGSATSKGFSCKDRVIHLLALRPHKKLEIFPRLEKEGMNQKERNSVGAVLQQVATMQDNCFKLNKHYFTEIKPDTWPHYSDAERALVKETLAQVLSQDSSPKVSSTSKSPEEKGLKRPLNDDYRHLSSKKQRVAKPIQDPSTSSSISSKRDSNHDHNSNKKLPDQRTRTPNSSHHKLSSKTELSKNGISRNGTEHTGLKHKTKSSENEVSKNGMSPFGQKLRTEKPVARISPINSYKYNENDGRHRADIKDSSPPTVASTSDIPAHIIKYQPIKSYEQRCKYKQDFQAQYREYIDLKENIDRVSNKFLELDRTRRKHPEDSQAAQAIKQKIFYLYEEHQKDEKYQEMKQKYAELYARLSHIKKLVVEYDQKHLQSTS